MRILRPKLDIPLASPALPAPVMFRSAYEPAEGIYPLHQHAWGEFVYAFSGVMEVKVAGQHYLAPPQYGVWLPPDLAHVGLNRQASHHASLYVSAALCAALPAEPCALTVSPLVRALLDHLRAQPDHLAETPADARLMQVLLDQLIAAPRAGSYLPTSEDPALGAVLRLLQANPGDNRSVAELAAQANTTERTLMRRCQRDLGLSLAQWRQRLRVVRAMALLESGQTVETIALDLGYGSASAFITMFKRLAGATPDEFRKGSAGGTKPSWRRQ
ncbi:MAG: helix-turn-helix transcriptional regulator [Rhodoferax sp.]|jgi:AraC-like DNA-binding protein|nr:helix-turn-helix transcriptional regulator [Rhodoferax sp.]